MQNSSFFLGLSESDKKQRQKERWNKQRTIDAKNADFDNNLDLEEKKDILDNSSYNYNTHSYNNKMPIIKKLSDFPKIELELEKINEIP